MHEQRILSWDRQEYNLFWPGMRFLDKEACHGWLLSLSVLCHGISSQLFLDDSQPLNIFSMPAIKWEIKQIAELRDHLDRVWAVAWNPKLKVINCILLGRQNCSVIQLLHSTNIRRNVRYSAL